ncbi:DUF4230 domain-containing protein [Faecalicatena sp. AGMB00832]|uniref:DUF4230 domain-containing protein n=1 Tax=Faecalicatena faecalis TaxID=2726362 RepID=A0ABS6CZT4_9FIRM|nr:MULTISPECIES: DUF4230 domain-containing protein [Faecalicatena]MBU3874835.1 DUF4230 domain-containing protein [Faecalicatena faecalis]MCI6465796.1 DUF4230 domain-containing protein [Faecalicatena sp.]MDY5618788.1 DUF4230 domain-containing protein [Lachnospiraceae bacterium]
MKKMRSLIIIIAAAALIAVGFLGARLLNKEPKVTVSATSIEERLSKCSSLTTARLDYRGIIKYSEGEIDFITKKSFSMIYDAHIKAGIDLSQAEVKVSGKEIQVKLPSPKIQDISIDSDSLEFYDEKFALFNWTNKEDTTKAIAYAKEDASAKAGQTDILTQAREQAVTVIETLIQPIADDSSNSYTLKIIE